MEGGVRSDMGRGWGTRLMVAVCWASCLRALADLKGQYSLCECRMAVEGGAGRYLRSTSTPANSAEGRSAWVLDVEQTTHLLLVPTYSHLLLLAGTSWCYFGSAPMQLSVVAWIHDGQLEWDGASMCNRFDTFAPQARSFTATQTPVSTHFSTVLPAPLDLPTGVLERTTPRWAA